MREKIMASSLCFLLLKDEIFDWVYPLIYFIFQGENTIKT